MSKFNLEFRIKIVTEYLSGKSSTSLAKEHGISDDSVVLNWVHRFDRYSIEGLRLRSQSLLYTLTYHLLVQSGSGNVVLKKQE